MHDDGRDEDGAGDLVRFNGLTNSLEIDFLRDVELRQLKEAPVQGSGQEKGGPGR